MTASRDSPIGAVERIHKCRAIFRQAVQVLETHDGETVWEGDVHLFDLEGHRTATTCYAWTSPVEDSDRLCYYAILHEGPIKSAADAVRAAIVKGYRNAQER